MKQLLILSCLLCLAVLARAQPVNDHCSGATTVTPNGSCVNGSTVNATDGWTGAVGCQSGNNHPEVWYTFVAIGTSLDVNVTAGTLTGNIEFILVSASAACSGLTIAGSLCGASPLTGTINALQPGTTYYFTISSSTGSEGTFTVCVNNTSPPPQPGQDCSNSAILCNSNSFSQGTFSGVGVTENLTANTCFGGNERQSKWYKFTVGCSGTFEFFIDPNINTEDFDWAIWNTTAGCYSTGTTMGVPLACNWSGCLGNTGISTTPCSIINFDCTGNPNDCVSLQISTTALNLVAGQTYTLLIDNFTSSGGGFAVNFGGTAVIGPDAAFTYTNIGCGNYVFTKTCQTANSTYLWQFGDGATSTMQNTFHTYAAPGTYIVTLQVTDALGCVDTYSETITVGILVTPTFNPVAAICAGTPLSALPTTSLNGIIGTWSPALNNTTTTTYTFTPTAGQCAATTTLTITVNTPVIPTFNPVAAICSGTALSVLPTTSLNGITGTWSPALDNTTTTTYTFTPTAGQCAATTTLTITVNTPVIPTFNPVAAICSGTALSALPTTSLNGITGTWSPALNNTATTAYTFTPTAGQCATTTTLTITVNAPVTPTFNPVAAVCAGTTLSPLPTTSLNGITGTWSPALNNTTTTTYTFTPDAGQCATTTTLTITVNPATSSTTSITICPGQTPYSWNGQSYTTSGNYAVTLTSSTGCDSVASLNLSVISVSTSTSNATICNNQLPYSWNSQTITAAGTYSVTLVSASGCDSVATLHLSVNPVVTSTTNVTICNNQLPYSWNSQIITAAGTYSVTLISASGCDSVATLHLSVNPVVSSTSNVTICNNQLPYSWNSQTITAAGTYSVTLISASGCDSAVTLNLTVNPALASTTNATICDSQLPYTWNSQSYTATGMYSVTLTAASGCDSIATLNLTVNSSPPAPVIVVTTIVYCQGAVASPLTAIGSNLLWYTDPGAPASGVGVPVLIPSTATPGTTAYYVTQTLSGCESPYTTEQEVTVLPIPTSVSNITVCSNQLPYTWNGQTYTSAGTYSVTLTSLSLCDSVATLNLSVNPALASTTNTTICSNQLPYSWNGQTYTSAGSYTVMLTSASGCDSVVTLNLSVNPALASTTNTTICSNQLPYTWNGQTYTSAGTYSVTLTSLSLCDSVATLNLSVIPPLTSTTTVAVCANQLPYTWNGQPFAATGVYSVTLISAAGCDSIATLDFTVNPVYDLTINTTVCSGQLPYVWNGQSYTSSGTYSAMLSTVNGCDSLVTLHLTVNNSSSSVTAVSVCSTRLPYLWNSQSLTASGTYTASFLNASGCDSIATLNFTVIPVATSVTNVSVCSNQLPYLWNTGWYSTAGSFNFLLTAASGCDSIATLNLTVIPASASSTSITICNSQLPYTWNGQIYTSAGTYTVTLISANNCDSVATLNLSVNPALTATENQTICTEWLPYTWNGQTYTSAGSYTVILTSASGCDSAVTLNLTVSPVRTSTTNTTICSNQLPYTWNGQTYTAAGTYSFTFVSNASCDSIATLNLSVETVPPGIRYPTRTVAANTNLPLTGRNLGPNHTYTWSPPGGLDFGNVKDPVFRYDRSTDYLIRIRSANGCETVDSQLVIVSPPPPAVPNVFVPKAWSPNGDGHNDKLFPLTLNITQLNYFRIFNRWGQLVFETKTLNDGWNGIYKGQPMMADVYTWSLEAVGVNGLVFRREGQALLLR